MSPHSIREPDCEGSRERNPERRAGHISTI